MGSEWEVVSESHKDLENKDDLEASKDKVSKDSKAEEKLRTHSVSEEACPAEECQGE